LLDDAFYHPLQQIIDRLDRRAAVITRAFRFGKQHAAIAALAASGIYSVGMNQPPNSPLA
jgi:hypothetical protein